MTINDASGIYVIRANQTDFPAFILDPTKPTYVMIAAVSGNITVQLRGVDNNLIEQVPINKDGASLLHRDVGLRFVEVTRTSEEAAKFVVYINTGAE